MKIIAIVNEKGGVGKSAVAMGIATALHRQGLNVVLVDADKQGTARDWRAASPDDADLPQVLALDRPELLRSFKGINADVIIIDAPGEELGTAAAIGAAHAAIIVIRPGAADIWASAAAVKMIQQKAALGGKIEARFLLNAAVAGTKLAREVVAGDWNEYGIEIMRSTVTQRQVFAQVVGDGISVFDTREKEAQADINAVVQEMREMKWL